MFLSTVTVHECHDIRIGAESGAFVAHGVEHDHIAVFLPQFFSGVVKFVISFQCEADDNTMFVGSEFFQYVCSRSEFEDEFRTVFLFFNFLGSIKIRLKRAAMCMPDGENKKPSSRSLKILLFLEEIPLFSPVNKAQRILAFCGF